jgi:hypothetical protein
MPSSFSQREGPNVILMRQTFSTIQDCQAATKATFMAGKSFDQALRLEN